MKRLLRLNRAPSKACRWTEAGGAHPSSQGGPQTEGMAESGDILHVPPTSLLFKFKAHKIISKPTYLKGSLPQLHVKKNNVCVCVCPFSGHAIIHFVAVRGLKREMGMRQGLGYNVGKAEVVGGGTNAWRRGWKGFQGEGTHEFSSRRCVGTLRWMGGGKSISDQRAEGGCGSARRW